MIMSLLRGRRRLQPLFASLHKAALAGMNCGIGGTIGDSGELAVLRYVQQKLQATTRPLVIFDVGASEGEYSAQVVRTFGDDVRVLAFEPARVALETLHRRVENLPQVTVHDVGLGSANDVVPLFVVEGQEALSSLYHRRLSHFGPVTSRSFEYAQTRQVTKYALSRESLEYTL